MHRHALSLLCCSLLALLSGSCASSPTSSRIQSVEAFRAAKQRGALRECERYRSDDPRIWYDEKTGAGRPWKLGAGRWQAWDEHFRGHSERTSAWTVEGDRVWANFHETNDYFELTERGGGAWRATYFFDEQGKLSGLMISGVPGAITPEGRADEFIAWAREQHPAEAEYLMPRGSIDPTGDRAPRMRALLEQWRATIGLPPLP